MNPGTGKKSIYSFDSQPAGYSKFAEYLSDPPHGAPAFLELSLLSNPPPPPSRMLTKHHHQAHNDPSEESVSLTVFGGDRSMSPINDEEAEGFLSEKPRKRTPLPWAQLSIICLVRVAEPIAYTQIFPYVNQMVEDLHVTDKKADVGFYSGLVDSLFAVTQLFTVYQWGRLSDRIGRKPVIISGVAGVGIASFCFGMSTNFIQMLISRAFAGALSGNAAVISSMMGEITDETNQARAFPLSGAFWGIGAIIGPLMGGTLSHPAEKFPAVFGNFQFFHDHPFFLPCFIAFLSATFSVTVAWFRLQETLPSIVAKNRLKKLTVDEKSANFVNEGEYDDLAYPSVPQEAPSTIKLVSDPHVRAVLVNAFLLSFITVSYETVLVLWAYTPIELGGLARDPQEIGYALAATGVFGMMIPLVIFPFLQERFGTVPVYTGSMALFPTLYIMIPIVGGRVQIMMMGEDKTKALAFLWTGFIFISSVSRLATMAFSANMLVVRGAAPNQTSLGSTFGLAQSAGCIARATGPAFVSTLYALSIDKGLLGGYLVWIVMVCVACVGVISTKNLQER